MALRAKQISAGVRHSLALLENGTCIGWGHPTEITIPDFGGYHSLALLEDGNFIGCGTGDWGLRNIPNFLPPSPPYIPTIPDYQILEELTLANYQEIKQKVECPQCNTNIKKVLLDCNHAFCETCSSALTNCPKCSKPTISKHVFHKKYI